MKDLKEKAMFVAEVAVAIAVIALVQQKLIKIPVIGVYLPGGQ
jgi:hypothetical protein